MIPMKAGGTRRRVLGRLTIGACVVSVCAAVPLAAPRRPQAGGVPQPPPAGSYTFEDGRGAVVRTTLSSEKDVSTVVWPAIDRSWDTALVEVAVAADPGGLPYVEIEAAGRTDRQYFPPADTGPRWINLSFLRGALRTGTAVTFRPTGMALSDGPATIRLFSAAPDLSEPILVLAPHPDDAEIATFGLYAGRRATVVTVTAGNAGSPTYEAVAPEPVDGYRFKGRTRVIDSVTVPWQGGIPPDRTFNLGYFDARLADMHANPGQAVPERYGPNTDAGVYRRENIGSLLSKGSRSASWAHLVDDLESILRKVNPRVVAAPHPQLDSHLDHEFTTVALADALARWKKPVTLLLYTNHADGNRYPYGPAGTIMAPPPPPRAVHLDRVYSHPTPPDLQRTKLFALESMHDLRYSPTRQYQLAVGSDRIIQTEVPGPGPDITYLRRGPRSNELFYVYDQESVKPVIQAFLAGRSR
jgi:LmbE family N-acetylglucosaminyl deacetylase